MQTFNLRILTPEQTLFEGEVIATILPGVEGFFEILAHHAPLIAMLKAGEVEITDKQGMKQFISIEESFFEFHQNKGILLTVQN
jgi:F-type H+-transporting ATPase subunit epsilon